MRKFSLPSPEEIAPDSDMPQSVKEELNHQFDHILKEVLQAENNLNAEQSVVSKKLFW